MHNLKAALDPASIAVIGASNDPNKVGGRPIRYLAKFGYRGKVFPVNPKREQVQGYKSFPGVSALPEAPDTAVIALSGEDALQAVEDCAAIGVKIAIVTGSGFSESDPLTGKEMEQHMLRVARAADMRLVGPNSQGLANFGTGAVTAFSSLLADLDPIEGHIAVLSQSGAFSVVPVGFLHQRGIGVRHAHATGNEIDLTLAELAVEVAQDSEVKLMMLYFESIAETRHLEALAAVARDRSLPIIALKSGRTEAGLRAAQSHTGALANEDRVVDAFFAHHGIWRAKDTHELIDATELYLKGMKPSGRSLVSVSNSGAFGVMTADAASAVGMPMAKFSDQTRENLKRVLPSFAATDNPIDVTAAILSSKGLITDTFDVLRDESSADAILLGLPVAGPGMDVDGYARSAAHFSTTTGKIVVAAATQRNVAQSFSNQGIPVFGTESDAVGALNQYISHRLMMQAVANKPPVPRAGVVAPTSGGGLRMLNEAESLSLLGDLGIPVVDHRLCQSREEVEQAFDAIGGTVVVKGCSADVVHKSELGLVKVGVEDCSQAITYFESMKNTLEDIGSRFDGIIVAAMARGRREFLIGAHRDPVFGPVVVFGDGGKHVEIFRDNAILLAGFSREDVAKALQKLRVGPLLNGARGEPPMDIVGISEIVFKIGELMLDPAAGIASIDLNPVMVGTAGEGCIAVDAVVFRSCTIGRTSR